MNRRTSSAPAPRSKRRRRITLLWIVFAAAIIITLLATEQVALLYVLATLSVATLLIVVAWADLGLARRPAAEPAPFDDAAAIADNVASASTASGSTAPRTTLKTR